MKTDLKAVDKKIKELIDNDPQLKELFYIAAAQRSAAQLIQLRELDQSLPLKY